MTPMDQTSIATDSSELPVEALAALQTGNKIGAILIVFLALALSACGDSGQQQQPSSQKRIFDTQIRGLEKAQGVKDTVSDSAERLRSEEEAQSK